MSGKFQTQVSIQYKKTVNAMRVNVKQILYKIQWCLQTNLRWYVWYF